MNYDKKTLIQLISLLCSKVILLELQTLIDYKVLKKDKNNTKVLDRHDLNCHCYNEIKSNLIDCLEHSKYIKIKNCK